MDQEQKKPKHPVPELFRDFRSELTVHSPGRINMIGEHTDYNNGFVLPTAINKKIVLQFSKNSSAHTCNVYSKTYEKSLSFDLRKIKISTEQWENYILGVVDEIQKYGKNLKGFDCFIESNLPVGAGISSSAALECGIAVGLNDLFNLGLDRKTIAELSRDAEHNFVGTKCGIMDQYASVLSKAEHLILLDCETLDASYIPAHFEGYKILLLNTKVSHSLAESEYNTRRYECEQVVQIIQNKYPGITSLRDIDLSILEMFKDQLFDIHYKRAQYVLKENIRVLEAVKAIKAGDIKKFGKLMYQSHSGLKEDYEVSCEELDFLVDFSTNFESILGARMMGGGFGGCTINLIKEDFVTEFISLATKAYSEKFNIELQAIEALPEEGTRIERSLTIDK